MSSPSLSSPRPGPGTRTGTWIAAVCLLVAANAAFQLFWHRNGLTNEILTTRHPTAHDAREYVRAAEVIANGGGFTEAFGHGARMPGYSLFLSLFQRASDEPLRTVRFVQIAFSASIIALFIGILAGLTESRRRALMGGAVVAAWLPLYHYSPAILAETLSLWLIALLPFQLAWRTGAFSAARAAALGTTVACLVYLKPNHLLLIVPTAGFLLIAEGKKAGGRSAAITMAVTLALLAPWSAFLSRETGRFTPLTLLSGYNRYLGTGAPPFVKDPAALPFRVARATGLEGAEGATAPGEREEALAPAERDALYARKARDIQAKHPGAVALYGAAKVLHGFGFSFRGKRDAFLVLFFAASLWASVRLWRRGIPPGTMPRFNPRAWVCYFWLCTGVIALQMFLYLPNQRFKTVIFDPPALLMLILAASGIWDDWRHGRQGHQGRPWHEGPGGRGVESGHRKPAA